MEDTKDLPVVASLEAFVAISPVPVEEKSDHGSPIIQNNGHSAKALLAALFLMMLVSDLISFTPFSQEIKVSATIFLAITGAVSVAGIWIIWSRGEKVFDW